jgi:hypothetical protein
VPADGVADAVVERTRPGVHLPARDLLRIVDHRRQQARPIPPALPERGGERAVAPIRFLIASSLLIGTPKARGATMP